MLWLVNAHLISTPITPALSGSGGNKHLKIILLFTGAVTRLRAAWLPLRHIDAAVLLRANTFSRRASSARRSGGEADPGGYTFYFISI